MFGALLGLATLFWFASLTFLVVNLAAIPRLRPPAGGEEAPDAPDRISICVPARDEEVDVGRALDSLLALEDSDYEVILVDDRSTDRTAEILNARSGHPRLTLVSGVEPPPGWLGKPHAVEQAVARATGRWLLFVDADVRLHPRTLEVVRKRLLAGHDYISLIPDLETGTGAEKLLLGFLGDAVLWGFPSFLANARWTRRFGLGGGAFILIHRDLYDRIGGHAALRQEVVEDIALGREAKRAGGRCLIALAPELVTVRMYRGGGEVFRGFAKNMFASLGRSHLGAAAVIAHDLVKFLLPIGWIAVGFGAGAAIDPRAYFCVGAMASCRLAADLRLGRPPAWGVFLPLQQLAVAAMMIHSVVAYHRHGGVMWRGRVFDPS